MRRADDDADDDGGPGDEEGVQDEADREHQARMMERALYGSDEEEEGQEGADEEGDDYGWTLADVAYGAADTGQVPPAHVVRRLTREYHRSWIDYHPVQNMVTLIPWVFERFALDAANFTWDAYDRAFKKEQYKLHRLRAFAQHHNLQREGEMDKMFEELNNVLYTFSDVLKHSGRMVNNLRPRDASMRIVLPPEYRELMDKDNENIDNHKEEDNTNFQNAFCHIRQLLQGCNYRRAANKFFKRIVIGGDHGIETMAFEEACTIKEFVAVHTSYEYHFKAWRWITHPPGNHDAMVEFMTNRPLAEAPDLHENLHYRSYGGDAMGRGAGVYDCRSDMIFWYHLRSSWQAMAARAQALRRQLFRNPAYVCEPPDPSEVCVVHLDVPFPYDILRELEDARRVPLHLRWREVGAFECTDDRKRIPCDALASYLCGKTDDPATEAHATSALGQVWHPTHRPPQNATEVTHPNLLAALREGTYTFPPDEFAALGLKDGDVTPNSVAVLDAEAKHYAMPFVEQPLKAKVVHIPSDEEWMRIAGGDAAALTPLITPESFCRVTADDGRVRYFRPYAGRTWVDCEMPEIDHIFACQKFTPHDCFFIYALLGRLFFEVGELDTHEATLFFEGIGGSGKSTMLKAMSPFWPPHLRAVLSSNMQSQFGMSSIANGAVCMCSEVSQELNLPQEEWQDATGGAWLNLAVKHKEPLVMKWKAQFLWAGNAFPRRWNNGQGQVSRRLYGVGMYHPVQPRDGRIFDRILTQLGYFQRKIVLAYFEFLNQTGSIDPMSRPKNLPPAFYEYYRKGRRDTDPIEDFLSEGTFVEVGADYEMTMEEFKELYNRYRVKYDMGKPSRWGKDLYRTPFSERAINVYTYDSYTLDGKDYANVEIIKGVRAM